MQRKKKDLTDVRREEKKTKPTIRSWVAAKKLRAFLLSYREKKNKWKKTHIFNNGNGEENGNSGPNLWKKYLWPFKRMCWKCPLFHGSFVWLREKNCWPQQSLNMKHTIPWAFVQEKMGQKRESSLEAIGFYVYVQFGFFSYFISSYSLRNEY